MIISQLKLSDLSRMVEIEKENFSKPWTYKTLYYEVVKNDRTYFFGVFIEDNLVGYLGFFKVFDNVDILNIAVCNKHKRQGIGTLLFDHLIDLAQELKAKTISLEVRVNNTAALGLYEKMGFIKLRKINNYYTDTNEDAYLMQKVLV